MICIITTYQKYIKKNNGNFWIAVDGKEIIGTIALIDYKGGRGYLKRMYVQKNYRGLGVANMLLDTLLNYAKKKDYSEIFLGTIESMERANKFWKKCGFKKINSLPSDLPTYGDTIFYKYVL